MNPSDYKPGDFITVESGGERFLAIIRADKVTAEARDGSVFTIDPSKVIHYEPAMTDQELADYYANSVPPGPITDFQRLRIAEAVARTAAEHDAEVGLGDIEDLLDDSEGES